MFFQTDCDRSRRRRAVTAVLVLVMMGTLLSLAALTVDVGMLYSARADLQRAADAGALAGASAFTSDHMLKVRLGEDVSASLAGMSSTSLARIAALSSLNPSVGLSATVVTATDVTSGWIDLASSTSSIVPNPPGNNYNALKVMASRDMDGSNAVVPYFFASIFGKSSGEVTAEAVAAFDDRVESYDLTEGYLLPFTIHEDVYEDALNNGDDDYGYDGPTDTITEGSDGVREIDLFPGDLAPGNFGLLNIGTPNQGEPALAEQIENGVTPEDMEAETGSADLTFYNGNSSPMTYNITGDPGLKSSLESNIATRIGDVIAFLLHDQVTEQGSNATYQITGIRFGRVMDVELNGPPSGKGLWVQPAIYNGSGVKLSGTAASTGGMVGRIVLVR